MTFTYLFLPGGRILPVRHSMRWRASRRTVSCVGMERVWSREELQGEQERKFIGFGEDSERQRDEGGKERT